VTLARSLSTISLHLLAASWLGGCTNLLGTFEADGAGGSGSATSTGNGASISTGATSTGASPSSTSSGVEPLKRVFVTAQVFLGDFGKQDIFSLCNAAANEAKLGGAWLAWVSDGGDFPCEGGPWQLVDGSAMVGTCADLFGNTLVHPIDVTQFGKTVLSGEPFSVWTGVSSKGGLAHPDNCSAWQVAEGSVEGMVGDLRDVGPGWTEKFALRCDKAARLYCFEL
jgi:hypothetical protein